MPPITSIDEDFGDIEQCHNDPMVAKIKVVNFLVCKFLLNNENSVNVLY